MYTLYKALSITFQSSRNSCIFIHLPSLLDAFLCAYYLADLSLWRCNIGGYRLAYRLRIPLFPAYRCNVAARNPSHEGDRESSTLKQFSLALRGPFSSFLSRREARHNQFSLYEQLWGQDVQCLPHSRTLEICVQGPLSPYNESVSHVHCNIEIYPA